MIIKKTFEALHTALKVYHSGKVCGFIDSSDKEIAKTLYPKGIPNWHKQEPWDINHRERRLCSRLRGGVCTARKNFRTGEHDLTIFIKDKAGNVLERD